MPHYELDEYAQEHLGEDAVNVNCVASWRACADRQGRVQRLTVDLHNGWHFDSRRWRADVPELIFRALQLNERGRGRG